MQTEKNETYSLGLDIGIASVGWCLLGGNRIIDLGVRAFDKAETAKEGDSLNLVRRTARLMRRRLRRRSWRLTKLARTFKRHGVIADTNIFQPQRPFGNRSGNSGSMGWIGNFLPKNGHVSSITCASIGVFTGSAVPKRKKRKVTKQAKVER